MIVFLAVICLANGTLSSIYRKNKTEATKQDSSMFVSYLFRIVSYFWLNTSTCKLNICNECFEVGNSLLLLHTTTVCINKCLHRVLICVQHTSRIRSLRASVRASGKMLAFLTRETFMKNANFFNCFVFPPVFC